MATTGLVLNVKRFEIHDGDGIRTTLFLKGCPLRCQWCHNPESLTANPVLGYYAHKCIGCGRCADVCPAGAHRMAEGGHRFEREKCLSCGKCEEACLGEALVLYGKRTTPEEILPKLLEDVDYFRTSGGGVTISGGEPLMQAEFTAELLRLLKRSKINTALDTCLFAAREKLDAVIPWVDTFLADVKAIHPALHRELTGQDNALILDNLRYLSAKNCRIEIRVPYIPGKNSGEIPAIAAFLESLPHKPAGVRVLPYHNLSGGKYEAIGMDNRLRELPVPTVEDCRKAEEVFLSAGLKVLA